MEKIYYYFAVEKDENGRINKYYILSIEKSPEGAPSFSVIPPLSAKELVDKAISSVNINFERTDEGGVYASLEPSATTYPSVCQDETGIHLVVKPFTARYHRLNPKRIWPSKPELMRTVTVIAETECVTQRYVNYLVTNRKLPMLNKNYTERGYYVCDYNGTVAYLSLVRMQSIGNRYGFTNAKLAGNRVLLSNGNELMQLPAPSAEQIAEFDSINYLDGPIIKEKTNNQEKENGENEKDKNGYDKKQIRLYADSFFVFRRQQFNFAEGTPDEKSTIDEFRKSIEAFHQSLLHSTVPQETYSGIETGISGLLSNKTDAERIYKKIARELIDQIPCRYFQNTSAFSDMLDSKTTVQEIIITLQTLTELAPEIVEQYCGIILAEQEISDVLKEMSDAMNFEFQGFKFRLKSPDSLYEKLYERPNETGKTTEELFEETRDILRYTVCFNEINDYCSGIQKIILSIMERYHGQLNGFRNYWTPYVSGDYRGVNVSIRLPDLYWKFREKKIYIDEAWKGSRYCITIPSFCVEIQFITQKSFEVKMKNHELYEANCVSGTSEEERKKNLEEIAKNIRDIEAPKGAELLYMDTNEYITALYDFIDFLKGELAQIKKDCDGSSFIDQSLFDRN